MPNLGIGSTLTSSGMVTPGIVTDSLVLKHNYVAGAVVPVSDGAVYFDGAENINLGETTTISGQFSIAVWLNPANVSNNYFWGSGSTDYLRISSSTTITLRINNSAKTFGNTTALTSINTNEWIHFALTRDGSNNMTVYLNGVEQAENESSSDDFDYSHICSRETGNFAFLGYSCNFGIWSDTLTQAQIKSIMWKNYAGLTDSDKDAGTTGSSNLVSWWNLSTSAKDSHGSNDGSATFT